MRLENVTADKPLPSPPMHHKTYQPWPDKETGLTSMRWTLKHHTNDIHREVEKLPLNRDLMDLSKTIPLEAFRTALYHKYRFLRALEGLLVEKADALNQCDHCREVLKFFKRIFRADAYQQTLEATSSDGQLPTWPLPQPVEEYIRHLERVAEGDPKLLFPHAWTNLLDGLFGGQFIAPKIVERWGPEAALYLHYPNEVLDTDVDKGFKLKNARELVKHQFQTHFDAIPWRDEDYQRATEEAFLAFQVIKDSLTSIQYE